MNLKVHTYQLYQYYPSILNLLLNLIYLFALHFLSRETNLKLIKTCYDAREMKKKPTHFLKKKNTVQHLVHL